MLGAGPSKMMCELFSVVNVVSRMRVCAVSCEFWVGIRAHDVMIFQSLYFCK